MLTSVHPVAGRTSCAFNSHSLSMELSLINVLLAMALCNAGIFTNQNVSVSVGLQANRCGVFSLLLLTSTS